MFFSKESQSIVLVTRTSALGYWGTPDKAETQFMGTDFWYSIYLASEIREEVVSLLSANGYAVAPQNYYSYKLVKNISRTAQYEVVLSVDKAEVVSENEIEIEKELRSKVEQLIVLNKV